MNEKRKRLYKKKKTESKIGTFKNKKEGTNIKKTLYIIIGLVVFVVFVGIIADANDSEKIYIFSSRKYLEEKGIKNKAKYKEELVEEVDLAQSEGYYLGTGAIDGEKFYRFKVVKKGIESYDIEISDAQCSLTKLDDSDTSIPRVKAYKSTYENGQILYTYVISIKNADIKDFGGE